MQNSGRMAEDLAKSGLVVEDIGARDVSNPERAATNTPFSTAGYVIPYLNISGKPAGFYRVKLFDHDPKYKQPKDTPNHVYFPRRFKQLADNSPYIILTEGEKKAALCCKLGIPACALGGVDSWRNRIVSLPANAELSQDKHRVQAKVPAGTESVEDFTSPLALGMQDLIDYLLVSQKTLVICFDTDGKHGTAMSVQRAAAQLGFEMRFRGIPFKHIRQLILPHVNEEEGKTAIDDFILHGTTTTISLPAQGEDWEALTAKNVTVLHNMIREVMGKKSAFPRHPNMKDFLNKRLQKARMTRKEMQAISVAILSELDANGIRLWSEDQSQSFYFDGLARKLMRVEFTNQANDMTESDFGKYIYKHFGLGAADFRVIQWLGTLFTGEDPVEQVTPHRIFARAGKVEDAVHMQISDGAYVTLTSNGVTIKPNGTDGILFESGHVVGIDIDKFKTEWERQSKQPIQGWWMDVLNEVRLKDKDRQRIITALLFYISPWLYRWRGTQLPIEMTLGEAGSGKSTLQELRLLIQTGEPKLRNSPTDLKDWHASVANAGGLHVTDNVQLLDRSLRQRLSDEICRIITEPNPQVEMRKYYTNADLVRLPVRCVFGITAIQQPFQNQDILQRAILIELDKAKDLLNGEMSYNMSWQQQQLSRFGGREAWIVHHLIVLQKFFQLVSQKWNMRYSAKHRLINFEQILILMAEVFGINGSWIPSYLLGATATAVTESDWAFEGVIAFAEFWKSCNQMDPRGFSPPFTVVELGNWAMGNEDFDKCEILVNTRKLGKYLQTHKTMVASVAGIHEAGSHNNRQRYRVVEKK